MSAPTQPPSTEFDLLGDSWEMAMEADGYAAGTRHDYRKALGSFAAWLAAEAPDAGPTDATRDHVRGWLVALRRERSQSTARTYYAGVRHFFRWLVAEGEIEADPCDGIRSPAPALDRYLRERRRHPWATHEALWLGDRGRGPPSADGIKAVLARRGAAMASRSTRTCYATPGRTSSATPAAARVLSLTA